MPTPARPPTAAPPDLASVPMSDALRALAARCDARLYARGRLLIEEGDVGSTIYIILSGRLRAYATNADGSRELTYGVYMPGEFLGEMSLDDGPRSANVVTMSASWLVAVNRPTIERHLVEWPAFAFELLAKVIRRARAATLSLRAVALNDVYGRVVWLLNDRAIEQPDGTRLLPPMSHREMAEVLGCTPGMVTRVMKELKSGGYVESLAGARRVVKALPTRF